MPVLDPGVQPAAERVLAYLAATDPLPAEPADAVIGFGVFDLSLAPFCGELQAQRFARRIIFTGGVGAGTGNLGGPEADVWRRELQRSHPGIPPTDLIVESHSTNTAENIAFTAALLARDHPELGFGRGISSAILVASPSRLRRVLLTFRQLQPSVQAIRQRPSCSFAREQALYARNGVDYVEHLLGEVARLVDYAARGWIVREDLPADIIDACKELERHRSARDPQ